MSTQFSHFTLNTIEYSAWLVFDDKGGVRLTRAMPKISRYERRVKLQTSLPKSIFKEPELKAVISVPVIPNDPIRIDIDAARDALQGAIGCDIDMKINLPELES